MPIYDYLDTYTPNDPPPPKKRKQRLRIHYHKQSQKYHWYFQEKWMWWMTQDRGVAKTIGELEIATIKYKHVERLID